MPTIRIGQTNIAYELRRSPGVTERRIIVTPGHIEVLALATDGDDDIANFLDRKRQWLFNTMRGMERITVGRHAVPRFATGSRIPYRGRAMPLTVRRGDGERAIVTYRNGFIVDLPHWTSGDPDQLVASELRHWLRQRARRDVLAIAAGIGRRHGLAPRSIRVGDFVHGWGSCGPDGTISINWQLIFAPRKVLYYVVAHEMAHLRHRTHGQEFWDCVTVLAPGWEDMKAWLDRHQTELSADFLRL